MEGKDLAKRRINAIEEEISLRLGNLEERSVGGRALALEIDPTFVLAEVM